MNHLDITGNVYGRLTAKEYIETINKKSYWWFECKCGNIIKARADCVKSGTIRSCGCLHSECAKKQIEKYHKENDKHHDSKTKFYHTWQGIKDRCTNPNNNRYNNYGGRGIKCEWKTYLEFKNDMYKSFLEHCEEYGENNTTIDRIDVNGNYCKNNCRWATIQLQNRNRRSNVIVEMLDGSEMCLTDFAKYTNSNISTVRARYRRSPFNGTKRIPELYLRQYLGK